MIKMRLEPSLSRPLLLAKEMEMLEAMAEQHLLLEERMLMEFAGLAFANEIKQQHDKQDPIIVLCGSGNNGGDGYVIARQLLLAGYTVLLGQIGQIRAGRSAALAAYQSLCYLQPIQENNVTQLSHLLASCHPKALIIDAICGTGLHSQLRTEIMQLIQAINKTHTNIVSCDIPTGIDADTGHVLGAAIRARETITFGFAKRGHFLHPGASYCGTLKVVDIGIPPLLSNQLPKPTATWLTPQDGPLLLPTRAADSHKGHFGRAAILAGSVAMPGAGILACKGALASGVGLIDWCIDQTMRSYPMSIPPEVMFRVYDMHALAETTTTILQQATALLIGPGLGLATNTQQLLLQLLRVKKIPVCLDADAITMLALQPDCWTYINEQTVLTPHPKELARCMGITVSQVQQDRFGVVQQFVQEKNCWLVLKGANTIVGRPDGKCCLIRAGNPGMATAGSGDVLAGMLTGMVAQSILLEQAILASVLLHSYAGDIAASKLGQTAMCASDIVSHLPDALQQWQR